MEKKEEEHLVIGKAAITNDPVAFGALMDFQYGTGETFEQAQEFLFDRHSDLKPATPDSLFDPTAEDTLAFFREGADELRTYRLYVNELLPSLMAARILRDLEVRCQLVKIAHTHLPLHEGKSELPILVELELGYGFGGLPQVKSWCRRLAYTLVKNKKIAEKVKPRTDGYEPSPARSSEREGAGWVTDSLTVYGPEEPWPRVWLLNQNNHVDYRGATKTAPHPVNFLLGEHWYTKRGGTFHDIVVWNLGPWDGVQRKMNAQGNLLQCQPPVVLFADEIRHFNEKKMDRIVEGDSSYMHVRYDGYFLIDGNLYRIWAYMLD